MRSRAVGVQPQCASHALADMCEFSIRRSVDWFKLGVEQKDVRCCYHLATMYVDGLGVDMDFTEALRLFELAVRLLPRYPL